MAPLRRQGVVGGGGGGGWGCRGAIPVEPPMLKMYAGKVHQAFQPGSLLDFDDFWEYTYLNIIHCSKLLKIC